MELIPFLFEIIAMLDRGPHGSAQVVMRDALAPNEAGRLRPQIDFGLPPSQNDVHMCGLMIV
jgi:hypothetical protein